LAAYICPEPIPILSFQGPWLVAWYLARPADPPLEDEYSRLVGLLGQPSYRERLWNIE